MFQKKYLRVINDLRVRIDDNIFLNFAVTFANFHFLRLLADPFTNMNG